MAGEAGPESIYPGVFQLNAYGGVYAKSMGITLDGGGKAVTVEDIATLTEEERLADIGDRFRDGTVKYFPKPTHAMEEAD